MLTEIKKFITRLLSHEVSPANSNSYMEVAGGSHFIMANLLAQMCPTSNFATVTPHDTNSLLTACRAIYVGGAGNVVVINEDGESVTFVAVPAGTILPIATKQVKLTNTTATGIVAL